MKRISKAAMTACAMLAGSALADGDTLGRNMAASCATCHGTNGRSVGGMAVLAGYDVEKFQQAFRDFKSGAKPATLMHQIVRGYDEAQVRAMAAYFAAQREGGAK